MNGKFILIKDNYIYFTAEPLVEILATCVCVYISIFGNLK